MNSLARALKRIQMKKKPKVYCLYMRKSTGEIIIDKVILEAVKRVDDSIRKFKNPKWEVKQAVSSILRNPEKPHTHLSGD